ncbi:hypothetical protein [Gaetbulibacter aestuarii]|uniref:STAS/SEC14 domain-containing protein n=1 Tax=Gaetbulibacter aestuarii TaxID=1502358 RepID=A0ABW7MYC9_9FLAO
MNSYTLSFGEITILEPNLAEVIINEGIELDENMVLEYTEFLNDNLDTPYYLIINKKHSYSYTFGAQKTLANLEFIGAYAVVATNLGAVMSTETLVRIGDNPNLNLQIFGSREEALEWLETQY